MKYIVQKALIRALHTFWQTLAGATPVGLVITVPMIREADWRDIGLAILAWLVTAVLAAGCSFIKSMAVGMPETQPDTLTWEQFKADQGTVTVINTEEDHDEAAGD